MLIYLSLRVEHTSFVISSLKSWHKHFKERHWMPSLWRWYSYTMLMLMSIASCKNTSPMRKQSQKVPFKPFEYTCYEYFLHWHPTTNSAECNSNNKDCKAFTLIFQFKCCFTLFLPFYPWCYWRDALHPCSFQSLVVIQKHCQIFNTVMYI